MKKNLLFIFSVLFAVGVAAQSYEGSATYEKKKQSAILIEYDYSPEAVRNAVIQKFSRMGYTAKEEKGLFNKDKGYMIFQNATVSDISSERYDYIINVEETGKRKEEKSLLSLLINKSGETVIGSLPAFELGAAKSFLNNMLPEIEEAKLELDIKAQEGVVGKAEKKLKDLKDDQKTMEKKIADLENDLKKNGENQEKQQKEIESQQQALLDLKSKRKGASGN